METQEIGEHYLLEFIGCNVLRLQECETIRPALVRAAKAGNASIVGEQFHQFTPFGVTGVLLLAESHISIHTWPEHALAAVDIFTCGDTMNPDRIVRELREYLEATEVQIRIMKRTQRVPEDDYSISS
ncbi:MAG: adenosylmethionine decarboxylase [Bdellovibrionales bacterium]|nr:adenosylmethionine decarboxylase [Bdellovibrionales bacterium]